LHHGTDRQTADHRVHHHEFPVRRGAAALDEAESLLETGVMDSTGVLELVAFIEETWAVKVEDDDIVPENLDSVDNITAFVSRKLSETGEAARQAS
jgi:acyl carrier protein